MRRGEFTPRDLKNLCDPLPILSAFHSTTRKPRVSARPWVTLGENGWTWGAGGGVQQVFSQVIDLALKARQNWREKGRAILESGCDPLPTWDWVWD